MHRNHSMYGQGTRCSVENGNGLAAYRESTLFPNLLLQSLFNEPYEFGSDVHS